MIARENQRVLRWHFFTAKHYWGDRGNASSSVHTQANLGQYIHHNFFELLPTVSQMPCITVTVLLMSLILKQKQKTLILEIVHYQNKINRFITRFFQDHSKLNI